MAKNKKVIDFSKLAAEVIKVPLENFVEDSYLPYAHYVIMSRALISDDGLKPVQRRILYAMDQLGLTDKKSHIKAAQIVGETMGKYHPHGDASIGDALSRLGQDFSMRVPLVDVQGSVGFATGDAPAAPRYWEGRPTAAAMELTRDLKEGAIEIGLNYDGKFPEPSMLPIKWPNGIINGSQGIAVGYSSNVIPHNPTEVMDTIIALIKDPELTVDDILKIMIGPDFPTGGVLIGYEGVKDYYETGKGSFSIRGKYKIIPGARGTHQIVFNEAPYQISAEQVIKSVETNKKRDRFKEISYVKDLTGIDSGFELSIGIKAGANPEVVLRDIFKWTPLEQPFSANMNVLRYGTPQLSPIKTLLQDFIEFRSHCVINKVNYKIADLKKQIERLSGIIAVLVDIDKAISIIRKSEDANSASIQIMKSFKINEEQANYILSMPLRRLTKSDSLSIKEEIKSLKEEEEFLNTLLNDDDKFNEFLINELEETKKIIGDKRRTVIVNKSEKELEKEAAELKKANKRYNDNIEYYITLFADDTVIKTIDPYKQEGSPTAILTQVRTRAQENVIFLNRNGSALRVPVSYVPEDTIMEVNVVTGLPANSVVGIGRETLDKDSYGTLVATSNGKVNIVNGGYPSGDEFQMVKLDDDEIIVAVHSLEKSDNENKLIVMVTSDGYVSSFPVEQIRTSNSGAGTVIGININKEAKVVGVSVANEETAEVVSCTHQTIKVTSLKDIPSRNRSAKGVILQRLSKNDEIITAFASDRVVANKNDRSLRLPDKTDRAVPGTKRSGSGIVLGHHEL